MLKVPQEWSSVPQHSYQWFMNSQLGKSSMCKLQDPHRFSHTHHVLQDEQIPLSITTKPLKLVWTHPSVLWFRSLSLGSWWSFLSAGSCEISSSARTCDNSICSRLANNQNHHKRQSPDSVLGPSSRAGAVCERANSSFGPSAAHNPALLNNKYPLQRLKTEDVNI